MSVREEDRKKNCPSRGLGIAAAAIGVGVGAALYYIYSNRSENPAQGGTSTSSWSCEEPQVLHDHNSSYTTISEHSTTDTSINSSSSDEFSNSPNILQKISRRLWNYSGNSSEDSLSPSEDEDDDGSDSDEMSEASAGRIDSDDEMDMEWDVTSSSADVPTESRSPMMMHFNGLTVTLRNNVDKSAKEQMALRREEQFRERTWSLEECSICFDVMLKDQEVMALACTHRFHQACIMPWLEQRQTCPNCRKAS